MLQVCASCGPPSTVSAAPVSARAETMCTPGAVSVGWNCAESGTPREEKSASVPSGQGAAEFVGSGLVSLQPAAAAITHGAWAYTFIVSRFGPSLPAEKT